MYYTTLKNKLLFVKQVWGWQPLLSHLSLLDDVVGVTAGKAGALQKVHDIILTATITDIIKQVITWFHRVAISCDYMDSQSTAILTSPSSCLRSTGLSLRQWRGEGRLPLCRSEGETFIAGQVENHTQQQNWLVMSQFTMLHDYSFTPSSKQSLDC